MRGNLKLKPWWRASRPPRGAATTAIILVVVVLLLGIAGLTQPSHANANANANATTILPATVERRSLQSFNNFCSQLSYTVDNCTNAFVPRDLLFIVDKSLSQNELITNSVVLDYVQQLYCSFDASIGSRVGLISFGFDVRVDVPLAARSADEWGQAVEALKGNLDTTDGYTPLAEALETAALEFARAGDASHARLVIIVSDGQPFPMPVGRAVNPHDAAVVDTGFPLTGYPQYAARYYPTDVCLPAASDARSCDCLLYTSPSPRD